MCKQALSNVIDMIMCNRERQDEIHKIYDYPILWTDVMSYVVCVLISLPNSM